MRSQEKCYYGFWKVSDTDKSDSPSLEKAMDKNWSPPDKLKLLNYISECPVVLASGSLRTQCLECDQLLASSDYSSDGVWLWPTDLFHYLDKHHVKLPQSFTEHIREQRYKAPSEILTDWKSLPWP